MNGTRTTFGICVIALLAALVAGTPCRGESDGKHEGVVEEKYKKMTKDPDLNDKDYLWVRSTDAEARLLFINAWMVHGPDTVEISKHEPPLGNPIKAATLDGRTGQCMFFVVGRKHVAGIGGRGWYNRGLQPRPTWEVRFESGDGAYLQTQVNSPSDDDNVLIKDKASGSVVVWVGGVDPIPGSGKTYEVKVFDNGEEGGGQVCFMDGETSFETTLGDLGAGQPWREKSVMTLKGKVNGETKVKAQSPPVPDPGDPPDIESEDEVAYVTELDLTKMGLASRDAGGTIAMKKQEEDTYTNDKFTDTGNKDITNPVWQDTNWDDTPEKADPVCFLVSKRPKLTQCVLRINPPIAKAQKIWLWVHAFTDQTRANSTYFKATQVTLPANGAAVNVPDIKGYQVPSAYVNHFTWNFKWDVSGDASNWTRIQQHNQKVFVLLAAPLAKYAGALSDTNPIPLATTLDRTAKRIDWATKVCRRKTVSDIEPAAADYINTTNGFDIDEWYANPFTHLDVSETEAANCITIANLAATALRLNGVDARPAVAYCRYKVSAADNATWGWTKKMHNWHGTEHLSWVGNNFEGFYHIGPFVKWTTFPSKAYIVGPIRENITAPAGKEKYLPILVLQAFFDGADNLEWTGGVKDVEWKPTHSIPGLSVEKNDAVSWHSDDTNDDEYNITWDKTAKTLKLHTGAAVVVAGAGTKTLTVTIGTETCTLDVEVTDWAALQAAATQTKTVRIAPARTQADAP